MPLTSKRTPHEIRVNLSTPGRPVTFIEIVQQVYVTPEGVELEEVGAPVIESRELVASDPLVASAFGDSLAQAVAQAQASNAAAVEKEALLASALTELDALREEKSK
jgi:hypothetical protein